MKVSLNCVTQPILEREHGANESNFGHQMKAEEYMIYCARVSSPDNRLNHETAPKLLKYLLDAGHWSPFEMISIGFEIETSRAIAQQILRHRSFSFQEFSQRYAKVEAMEPVELRYQALKNRQSSTEVFDDKDVLNEAVADHIAKGVELYGNLIANGIAKESARFILLLTTQTTIVMHGTLRSWIHFLNQRCDPHAQKEIQLIAFEIRGQLARVCPWTAAALNWGEK